MAGSFHTDIAQRVSRAYESLSPGHRKIADFVLRNPAEAGMLNNVELARRCEVSSATATRFARAIGFTSFAEFRHAQIQSLCDGQSHAQRLSQEIDEDATSFDVLRNGLEQNLTNLRTARDRLDAESCTRAVDLILAAERIFAFGAGLSQYVIGTLVHGLEPYCRGNATNIGPLGNGDMAIRRVMHCTRRDLLIACSLPRYSADTIEITEIARDKGASVVCITDRPTSPLTKHSDVVFYVDPVRRLLPNSITSAVAIAEGLVAAVVNRRREELEVRRTLDARHGLSQIG